MTVLSSLAYSEFLGSSPLILLEKKLNKTKQNNKQTPISKSDSDHTMKLIQIQNIL